MASAPSFADRLATKWNSMRPVVTALIFGLIAGPAISTIAGWQILTSTAQAQLHDGLLEQQVKICAANASATVKEPGKLNDDQRMALANKWAIMPGATSAEPDVAKFCSYRL
jgi:hypothetical protein